MPESTPKWLRALPLILALFFLAEAAMAGLVLVRLRHSCADSADAITELRWGISEKGRRLQEAGAQIAYAQRPDVLRDRVGNRLAPMQAAQIVWVGPAAPRQSDLAPLPALSPRVALLEPALAPDRTR